MLAAVLLSGALFGGAAWADNQAAALPPATTTSASLASERAAPLTAAMERAPSPDERGAAPADHAAGELRKPRPLVPAPLEDGRPGTLNPWADVTTPAPGPARAIGAYSSGCVQGAQALPFDGPGYQVMQPRRRRYFGHPQLVDYIQKLGQRFHDAGHGPLLIGDLSQPRGGRMADGHSSHQIGLDVDVWFWRPEEALKGPLPLARRDELEARSVLDADDQTVSAPWRAHVASMLRLAVQDPRVDRIFVHPAIKRELCTTSGEDRAWLRRIRPWHGHDDHFHARLACPTDDATCKPQKPLPQGDGCDQLQFWFSAGAQKTRSQALSRYQRNVREGFHWPMRCEKLL